MTDRELLEKCRAHLQRMVGRYLPPNTGDRKLLQQLDKHLCPPKENA